MKDYFAFIEALGKRESNNNYRARNKFGYLGRWQFGKQRLYDLGLSLNGYAPNNLQKKKIITDEQFLNDRELQDKIMAMHVSDLVKRINKHYKDYLGKKVNEVEITLSGCVAGVHLKGFGKFGVNIKPIEMGLRHFLLYKLDNPDGNGTMISSYIKQFAGYDLTNIPKYESS